MKKFVLLFVCLCLLKAEGADWLELTSSTNGNIQYVDTSRIDLSQNDERVSFWIKHLYKYNKQIPLSSYHKVKNQRLWYTIASYTIDCSTKKLFGPYSWLAYGLNSQLLDSQETSYSPPSTPAPETISERWVEFLCDYRDNSLNPSFSETGEDQEVETSTIDMNRWKTVDSALDGDLLILIDPQTIENCSSVQGSNCLKSNYSPTTGYRFWITVASPDGTQYGSPEQKTVDCKNRIYDGNVVAPESPTEPIINYFCR